MNLWEKITGSDMTKELKTDIRNAAFHGLWLRFEHIFNRFRRRLCQSSDN